MWQHQFGRTAAEERKALERRGAPVPKWLNPPEILPGVDEWYLAFWELSTERRFPGGPIPESAIRDYPTFDKEVFRECMRAADRAYLEQLSKPKSEQPPTKVFGPGMLSGGSK